MSTEKAFQGVKVVDFCWGATGPTIAKYLGDHGAEVIRVESSKFVDANRLTAPYKDGMPGINRSFYPLNYHNNKYGLNINELTHPKGLELAKKIVAWADVFIESWIPGTMKRLGLGYEEIKQIKPDIIMLSTCNQGQTGPRATQRGYGTQLTAAAGYVHVTGWPDRSPVVPCGAYTDICAARQGAAALLAALDYRRRTGKGQHIDLSQLEAAIRFLSAEILDFTVNSRIVNRMGNRCSYAAPHGAYPCRGEDKWCVIAVFTDQEWQNFCQAIGSPTWTTEPKFSTLLGRKQNEDELDELVAKWTINSTAKEVMVKMQSSGVSAGVVQTAEDLHQDPQLKHRHFFWELTHTEIGKYQCMNHAFKLSKTPCELHRSAPCLGEHSEYVCTEILGISDEEFVNLDEAGVFRVQQKSA